MSAEPRGKKEKSPARSVDKVLGVAASGEIKKFLTDCVNLPNPIDYSDDRHRLPFDRWCRKWGPWFTYQTESADGASRTERVPTESLALFAPIIRTTLVRMWDEGDSRQRDWYCYRLRDAHRLMVRHLEGWGEEAVWGGPSTVRRVLDYALQDVPRIGPFEAAVVWLQANQGLALRCGDPSCAAPYFFRTDRRQRYCSPECADAPRREAKRRWWNENRGKTHAITAESP